MKKKILSLLLVLVLAVGVLSSCGYSYEKDDMTGYTDFNLDAFKSALGALEIEDGEFSADETKRQSQVTEKVNAALAAAATKGTEKKEGVIGKNAVLKYCYYYTAEIESVTHYFGYNTTMKVINATTADLSATEGLAKLIADAVSAKDIKDVLYANKTGNVEDGDTVFLSFTYSYTPAGGATESGTVRSVPYKLTAGDALADKIIGLKSPGTSVEDTTVTSDPRFDGEEVLYKNVKVDFFVSTTAFDTYGSTVKETTYTDAKNVTDCYDKSYDLKDVELTYHIYPVLFYDIPTLSARTVLENLLGTSLKADSLECFADTDTYKYNDGSKDITLKSVIETLVADIADKDKTPNYDTAMTEIEKMTGAADKIVEDYKKTQYDSLLGTYRSEIRENLAGAIWDIIAAIEVKVTPERAVKETYDHNYKSYKYDFYTGKYADNKEITNKDWYKTLDNFIIQSAAGLSETATIDDAKAKLMDNAKEEVKDFVRVFTVAKAFDIKTSNTEVENFAAIYAQYSYYFYGSAMSQSQIIDMYGENNIRIALTFDKLLDHLLETDAEDADKYLNLTYTIKEEN